MNFHSLKSEQAVENYLMRGKADERFVLISLYPCIAFPRVFSFAIIVLPNLNLAGACF